MCNVFENGCMYIYMNFCFILGDNVDNEKLSVFFLWNLVKNKNTWDVIF